MANESLSEVLTRIRSDRRILDYDEITTKQKIILQILTLLDWNIFSDEVVPEYSVEGKRVDYSLRLTNRNLVFLEIKKPKEDLQEHERQLLDYAFRQGVEIAILTNGITWWFYLPTKPGDWNSRKFYTIDLSEQEIPSCAERLTEFLFIGNVQSGEAVKSAEKIHKSRVRKSTIDQTLPESWNKLISEPDELLVDLLIDSTEKLCGYRPETSDIQSFLKDKQEQLLLDTADDLIVQEQISKRRTSIKNNTPSATSEEFSESVVVAGQKSGLIKVRFKDKVEEVWSIPKLYLMILKRVVDSGDISKLSPPWGFGSKRYFLFKGLKPRHPNGRDFFTPVSYKDFHLEANVNRDSGIRYIKVFCEEIGYKLEILES